MKSFAPVRPPAHRGTRGQRTVYRPTRSRPSLTYPPSLDRVEFREKMRVAEIGLQRGDFAHTNRVRKTTLGQISCEAPAPDPAQERSWAGTVPPASGLCSGGARPRTPGGAGGRRPLQPVGLSGWGFRPLDRPGALRPSPRPPRGSSTPIASLFRPSTRADKPPNAGADRAYGSARPDTRPKIQDVNKIVRFVLADPGPGKNGSPATVRPSILGALQPRAGVATTETVPSLSRGLGPAAVTPVPPSSDQPVRSAGPQSSAAGPAQVRETTNRL